MKLFKDTILKIKTYYIWILIFAAVLLRIYGSLAIDAFEFPDSADYNKAAIQILEEHSYPLKGIQVFFRPPFYPLFLAALYKISFQNILLVKIAQALLGGAACYLIFLIAKSLFNKRVAFVSFILAAINPFFIQWTGSLQTEALFLFLFLASICLLIRYDKTNLRRDLFFSSIFLALATLTKPVGLIIFPFLCLFLFLKRKNGFNIALRHTVIFIAAFFCVILPWTIRNYKVYHEFIFINNAQGVVFWGGNNEIVYKMFNAKTSAEYQKYNKEYWDYSEVLLSGMKDLPNKDMQARLSSLAFGFIYSHPKEWMELKWKNFLFFWHPYLNPFVYPKKEVVLSFAYLFPIMFLGLFGFFRQFWLKKVEISSLLLILFIFIAGSFQVLINVAALRYRMPIIDPFLIIFASGLTVDWANACFNKNKLLAIHRNINRNILKKIIRKREINYYYKKGICKLPYPPDNIQVEPTNYCNLKCLICRQSIPDSVRKKGFMSMELLSKIAKDAKGKVFLFQFVVSGEPLLHKNIIDMIKLVDGYSIRTNMHTNALLLNEGISERLIKSGLDEIFFSFDTVDESLYEKLRSPAKFKDALNKILLFIKIKKKLKAKRPMVMMQNLQIFGKAAHPLKIEKGYMDVFKGMDVNFFVKYYSNPAGKFNNNNFSCGPVQEFFPPKGSNYTPCAFHWQSMVVGWDGKVLGCCDDFSGESILGDLNHEGIMDVWNGEKTVLFRKKLLNKEYKDLGVCRDCANLWR
ncbi:MAG: glycosyltransferase family 39 protein [Candidatus Omnitrophota bacterium]|nr:glycosyltransferase family 39 protein [Candidatus Omnitrophota bacterium]